MEYMKLRWDENAGEWNTVPGLNMTVPRFGEFYSIESLDPSMVFKKISQTFLKFKKHMLALGYTDGVDLVSAGYDWRHPPNGAWRDATRALVERAVAKTGRKAVLVAHSMGCPYAYAFLMSQDPAWVERYIDSFVAAAGPWSGTAKAANSFFVGFGDYVPIAGYAYASLARNLVSTWLLLPRPNAFGAETLLATTPSRNYTYAEVARLLEDSGMDNTAKKLAVGWDIFTRWGHNYTTPPGVPTFCLAGSNQATPGTLVFTKDIERGTPNGKWTHSKTSIPIDGDGTVPTLSAEFACRQWERYGANATTITLSGAPHLGMVKDTRFFRVVTDLACSSN